jgi:quercetin dioxygenase-like cupin family protein
MIFEYTFRKSLMSTTAPTKGSLLAGSLNHIGEQKGLILLSRNGQRVIYKTFQAGEVMPKHHAPDEVLVTSLAGQLELDVEGEVTLLQAGDYLVIPAGAPHALRCLEDAKLMIFR